MYNKLFTKILDSSIWLEPTATRIVWLTLIAGMDEDGFVALASVANLAHRARVSVEEASEAVGILESPDENSSDPEHEGRRIERTTGGWIVLNGPKYRDLVTRTVQREQTRARVAKHRAKKSCNAEVTDEKRVSNDTVTQSEAVTETETPSPAASATPSLEAFEEFWKAYPKKKAKGDAEKAWKKLKCDSMLPQILVAIRAAKSSVDWTREFGQFIPHPASWLNSRGWEDELFAPLPTNGSHHPDAPRGEFAKPMNKPPEPPAHILAARANES